MSLRALWIGFWALLALFVLSVGSWALLLRPVPLQSSNDPAWVFNHGSIGNEAAQGLPYWIWRVMPVVFSDLVPGQGRGYAEFGMHWEMGEPVPVGFALKTVGVIPRVAPNCAFCHQGSYRLRAEQPARLVSAGAGTRVDPQAYIRFLAAAGDDPRFTADRLMGQIDRIADLPWWESQLYRRLLIPLTRKALHQQGVRFAWTETRPDWGPGRIDPFNPVKFQNLNLPDDGTIGNSDMMPLWEMDRIEATPEKRYSLHWDGLLTDIHETVVAGAIGDGMTYASWPGAQNAIAVMEDFLRRASPPPSPFSSRLAANDPLHVDAAQVARGQAIFGVQCAECHHPGGERFRSVIPIDEVGTDRHRLDMWTAEARDRYDAYEPHYDWDFQYFEKTDGYVATELTGLWLKAPYLHNGSVPTLAALLDLPGERPPEFRRGSDLVDARKGGFASTVGADPYRNTVSYDTRLPGNDNGGHLWGTDLSPKDKAALLAFLKTL